MANRSLQSLQISVQTARKYILACQELYPPRKLKGTKGALTFLDRVRSIQFDPINVVGRNPDLVLQSRVKDFDLDMLDDMLYKDRSLVDNWDKMASLSLTEDWPYFSRHRSRMEDIFGVPTDVVMTLAPVILEQIMREGPQCSLDFKHQEKTNWAWGPTRVSRATLEGLFKMGQLGVHHRVNNRRYFDLIENLLDKKLIEDPDPNQTLEDYQKWHVLRRIGALGLAHPNAGEQWGGMIGVKSPQRKNIIENLVSDGMVVEVEIEELPARARSRSSETAGALPGALPGLLAIPCVVALDHGDEAPAHRVRWGGAPDGNRTRSSGLTGRRSLAGSSRHASLYPRVRCRAGSAAGTRSG